MGFTETKFHKMYVWCEKYGQSTVFVGYFILLIVEGEEATDLIQRGSQAVCYF